jgi:hypothetical protein
MINNFSDIYFVVSPIKVVFLISIHNDIFNLINAIYSPLTVAARSKVWNVFDRLNTGIVGSNPARGMDVCLSLFCVCVVLCK